LDGFWAEASAAGGRLTSSIGHRRRRIGDDRIVYPDTGEIISPKQHSAVAISPPKKDAKKHGWCIKLLSPWRFTMTRVLHGLFILAGEEPQVQ
jgi:hypothetical protein